MQNDIPTQCDAEILSKLDEQSKAYFKLFEGVQQTNILLAAKIQRMRDQRQGYQME